MTWFGPSGDCGCCGECSCTELAPAPVPCQCQTEDYGAFKTFGTVTITISGTHTATAATSPACSAPGSCASVNGTYVIACSGDIDQYWRIAQFVCTSGGLDYYYINTLRLTYQPQIGLAITVRLGSSKTSQTAGLPNPFPTLESYAGPQVIGSGAVLLQYQFTDTNTVKNRWTYVLGGACREECNASGVTTECNKVSGAVTLTSSYLSGNASSDNVCHPSSLTVSASITAPA